MGSKLGKALGFSMDMGKGDDESAEDAGMDEEGDGSDELAPLSEDMEPKAKPKASAEVMAMKLFEKASSPEAKVEAFRALLESCGVTGTDY